MKKIICMCLVLALVFCLVPGAQAAATPITVYFQNNWLWTDVRVHYWGAATNGWPGDAPALVENDGSYDIYAITLPAGTTGMVISGIKNDGSGTRDQTPDIINFAQGDAYRMRWADGNIAEKFRYTPPTVDLSQDVNQITLRIHYSRSDGDYTGWNVAAWNDELNRQYDFQAENGEMVATALLPGRSTQDFSFKIRKTVGTVKWAQEEAQVRVDLSSTLSGTVDVYVTAGQGQTGLVRGADTVTGNKIADIQYNYSAGTLSITTNHPVTGSASAFSLVDTSQENRAIPMTLASASGSTYTYTPGKALPLNQLHCYQVLFLEDLNPSYAQSCLHSISYDGAYYTDAFIRAYTYEGSDLGATYGPSATAFRLWAPTATAAAVRLYATGSDGEDGAAFLGEYPMAAAEQGTWKTSIDGDLKNVYYTYAVSVGGETVEAIDPYARAAGVNGQRGMILDLDATDPEGWDADRNPNPLTSYTDAIIYELHVRDFSIDPSSGVSEGNRGKYLAFTETGTTVGGKGSIPTGVDYLKNLGITHLHLLPIYDYGSVDESQLSTPQFNWGYDPVNYNVPEGSYSTNPYDGNVRIAETKQMVQSLHENGISVIMDVVYNHVYDASEFSFNRIVPGYFSRVDSNTSGCGNDTASERTMVRKYIVESVLYWAEEYHIDGFRFDLVGLLDVTTINQIVQEVHAVRPDIIFYGEGWDMDGTNQYPESLPMAKQWNAPLTPGFAYFSDSMRNLLAGNNGHSTGFVSGAANAADLAPNFLANPGWTQNPQQVIQYASCHDNHTLADKLIKSTGKSRLDAAVIRQNNLAAAMVLTAQGVPFLHAGEELLREKLDESGNRVENSYNATDYVNHIRWDNLENPTYAGNLAYYQGLISFRKAHAALRLETAAQVQANVVTQHASGKLLAYHINGSNIPGETHDGIYLIYNAGSTAATVTLPAGQWQVCINGDTAGTAILETLSGSVSVPAVSALVLVQEDAPENTGTSNVAIPGDFNGWDQAALLDYQSGSTVAMTVELAPGTYQFKVKAGDTWLGNIGTIADTTTATSAIGWKMDAAVEANCTLEATGGTYTFLYDTFSGYLTVRHESRGSNGYSLFGYINCAEDTSGLYRFDENGELTVTFQTDCYVGVQKGGVSYYTDGWLGSVPSATLSANVSTASRNRLMVPGGVELTLTMRENADGTVTLAYTYEAQDVEDTSGIQQGVTLHCWNWSFREIEENLPLIAAQGYTAIQTSPVQPLKEATNLAENTVASHWWVYYQPVSFTITSGSGNALGTAQELQSLINAAHGLGIQVIVDVVTNHLGNETGNDLAAEIPDKYLGSAYWHTLTTNTSDYSNRYDVTQHCMGGLPDLNTANKALQGDIVAFLNALVDMGVDGFRFDAAKHIETPDDDPSFASDFWPTVVNGTESYAQTTYGKDLYIYGELLDSINGVSTYAYTKYMAVTDNTWGNALRKSIAADTAALNAGYDRATTADALVIWAESHDTYATDNAAESSYAVSEADILKTWALVAARKDAMALYLARPADILQPLGVASQTAWADPAVKAINTFHNDFAGQSEHIANEGAVSYIERGTQGAILVLSDREGGEISVTAYAMESGSYVDQLTGNVFTVENGKISGTVGSSGIAVVSKEKDAEKSGLLKAEDGNYYYYVDGAVATGFTGLVDNAAGRWYISNGMAQLSFDGVIQAEGTRYLIKGGRVNTAYTGLIRQDGGIWLYFANGVQDMQYVGLVTRAGMQGYVEKGQVNFNKTAVVDEGGTLKYVKYGIWRNSFKGLARTEDGRWIYMAQGKFDPSYTGVAKLNANWVYVEQGVVNFQFSGSVEVNGAAYTVKYGVVQF